MSVIQNTEVSVSEGLKLHHRHTFVKLHRHTFETFDVPRNNRDGCFSGVQHKGFDLTIFRGCG